MKLKRKEAIFSAALQCFNEKGYSETSISMIASRAGISKGGLYHYFSTKRELFMALFLDRVNQYSEQLKMKLQTEGSAEKRLELLVRESGQLLLKNEDFYRFCLEFLSIGARDAEIRTVMTRFYRETVDIFTHIINEGVKSGSFSPIDSQKVARMLYFTVMGAFFTLFSVEPDFMFSDQLSFQIDFMRRAL